MIDYHLDIDSPESLKAAQEFLAVAFGKGSYSVHLSSEKEKTDAQRSSLHIWCRQLAKVFNDAGLDMKAVLHEDADIPWTEHSVKENIYKPVLKALTGKKSTEDQSTTDPSEVREVICRHLANNEATAGVEIPPWPTRFNQMEAA